MAAAPSEYNRLMAEIGLIASQFKIRPSVVYTTTGASVQLFIPGDNTRWGIVILNLVGNTSWIKWDNVFAGFDHGIKLSNPGTYPLLFKFSDYGALVQQEWYLSDSGLMGQKIIWAPIVLG